jgi:hypothetical protein
MALRISRRGPSLIQRKYTVYRRWILVRHSRAVESPASTREHAGLDRRARLAIAACVVLPVLIGIVVTAGTFRSQPAPPPPIAGHWVYVPSIGAAVHVDGGNRKVDATIQVGSASPGSLVVQDQHANYVVDYDKTIVFTRSGGVTDHDPSPGVDENPVPMLAAGTGYLVYRAAGMIMPLGSQQQIMVGGPLGVPVMTPTGELWVNRTDNGDICVLEQALRCETKATHPGALTLMNGKPGFVDTSASMWQPLTTKDRPVKLGVDLPANAIVGGSSVAGRIPVINPAAQDLLLIAVGGGAIHVPLGAGNYDRPSTAGDAVAVFDKDTGKIATFDAQGKPHSKMVLRGDARMTQGDDGRVYVDSTDGLESIVMDPDGTLTSVPTSDQIPPVYRAAPAPTSAQSLPPANVAPTTTETIPPAPETVTLPPTTTEGGNAAGGGGADGSAAGGTSTKPKGPTSTKPLPGAPPGSPTVDVLGATALSNGQARVHIAVHGKGPVFCHVFFNSVERAATKCTGEMDVTATGIPPHQLYDIYVLGVNSKGTGNPGRRGQLTM